MLKYSLAVRQKSAELYLYGPIGQLWGEGISAKQVVEDLKGLPDTVQALDVRINSEGGSVVDGTAIYQALARFRGLVTAYVDGFALSVASLILQAAERRVIAENGWLMLHQPWTIAVGDAREMRKQADLLEQMAEASAKVYADRSGQSIEQARAWMPPGGETWMGAAEAVRQGLADTLAENVRAAARWVDLSRFRERPTALQQALEVELLEATRADQALAEQRRHARGRLTRQRLELRAPVV